jgi:hypothetical protein
MAEVGSADSTGHPAGFLALFRPVLKPNVVVRQILRSSQAEAIDRIILKFFAELQDTSGYARPEHMGGFPPARSGRPRAEGRRWN